MTSAGRLAVFVLLTAAIPLRGEDPTEAKRFLRGLRERRLFQLADRDCQQRLANASLSANERTQTTIEWILCWAEQAMDLPSEQRAGAWKRAREIAADFCAKHPDLPQRILVQMQDCLTLLAQGEQLRMEAEISPVADPGLEPARQAIRECERGLEKLSEDVRQLGTRPARSGGDGGLSSEERKSIELNAWHQRARAWRNMALCYPAGSADRTAALQKSLDQLREILPQSGGNPQLDAEVRLDQIVCLRLSGDLAKAQAAAEAFPAKETPGLQPRWLAEKTRLTLQMDGPEKAWKELSAGKLPAESRSAELDFARLETLTALWQKSVQDQNEPQAKTWQDQVVASVREMERRYGGYWGRRADLLLLEKGRGRGAGNVDLLERAANEFCLQDRLPEAAAGYDEAARAAREAGDPGRAFSLDYRAALVLQKQERYRDAAQRFRKLALDDPDAAQAANAHAMAIVNLAQEVSRDVKREAEYGELLAEHLRLWPTAATSPSVWLWSGKWNESRANWAEAAKAYRQIAVTDANAAEALQGAVRCWLNWLRDLKRQPSDQASGRVAAEAADSLEQTANKLAGERAAAARLQAVRIRIEFSQPDYHQLESTLRNVIEASSANAAQKSEATALLAVALAGQPGREPEAQRYTEAISQRPTSQLWLVLSETIGLLESATDEKRQAAIADFALQLLDRLDPSRQLTASQRCDAQRWRALALEKRGRRAEALKILKDLARQFPDDALTQETLGMVLLRAADAESARQALDQWRLVVSRTRPRTEAWFRAKYHAALAQCLTGDKAGAAQAIRYLQLTEDLKASGYHAQFAELLDRCSR